MPISVHEWRKKHNILHLNMIKEVFWGIKKLSKEYRYFQILHRTETAYIFGCEFSQDSFAHVGHPGTVVAKPDGVIITNTVIEFIKFAN